MTGLFRSSEIKCAGTVLLNTGKICADSLLQWKISERMTKIYRMGSNSFSHSLTKHVKKNYVFQSVLKRQILTDFIQKKLATFAKL